MDPRPLTKTGAPWLHVLPDPSAETLDAVRGLEVGDPPRPAVRIVRGAKSPTVADFYDEVSAALQFPTFGENWDALHDALCDLRWLHADGCVIVVTDAARLLDQAPEVQRHRLYAVLQSAAGHWGRATKTRAARPFHV